ncbi:hydroxypyruvate isomerase family protein [Belliella kenyensis]|uniref:Hydroxypyruvate isomerase family protein n=1 Tax=Belliella kenyensis TaxID=1472724 RepID=A0ABV8ELE6_9BACT|nr:TIM barrel protein [Belliella kenyensis]MCH7400274.1 TIM barrel protein [Belliella kenyensis]MDN3604708.1 TIM barrel protein [Belliella kenyensis]
MKRRKFIEKISWATVLTTMVPFAMEAKSPKAVRNFKLNYGPHFGMFEQHAGKDLMSQLDFMADQGFRSLEDNGMLGRSTDDQNKISKRLEKLNMKMGVFVVDGGDNWKVSLTSGKREFLDNFLDTCKRSVEVAKRVNAQWMTVVPGFFERNLPIGIQTGHVIEALKRGAEIFEPHGMVMVLEPLSDTPELFLRHSDQSYSICKAVGSPACKILYDSYHLQRNEGNLISNIDKCWDEIAYFQVGDNPGRKEPGTGEINHQNMFKYIYDKGYDGIIGMEHGLSQRGLEGEKKLIASYVEADNF